MKSILGILASSLLLWLAFSSGASVHAWARERPASSFLTDIGGYGEPAAKPSIQQLPPPQSDSVVVVKPIPSPPGPSSPRGSFLLENTLPARPASSSIEAMDLPVPKPAPQLAATPSNPPPESPSSGGGAPASASPEIFFLEAESGTQPRSRPVISRLELPLEPYSTEAGTEKPSMPPEKAGISRQKSPAPVQASFLLDSTTDGPPAEPVVSAPNTSQEPFTPPAEPVLPAVLAEKEAELLQPRRVAAPAPEPLPEPALVVEAPKETAAPRSFLFPEQTPAPPLAASGAEPIAPAPQPEAEQPVPADAGTLEKPEVAGALPEPPPVEPVLAEAMPEIPEAGVSEPGLEPEQASLPEATMTLAEEQPESPAAEEPLPAPEVSGTMQAAKEPEAPAEERPQTVAIGEVPAPAETAPTPSGSKPELLPTAPRRDLSPWNLVEAGDISELPVFDSSMPVIKNEIARLQLEEWMAHISKAVDNHPSVQAASFAEQESISAIGEAKAQLYPQVSVALNTDMNRAIRDEEPSPTVSGLPADDEIRLNPSVTLRQMLFDGGATSNRGKAAAARSEAARERRVSTEEGVALRAAATMIELAKAQEQLEFAQENLTEVSRLRDMIRERVNAGRDAPSEMLQMNSRIFEARNQVVLIEGRRAEAGARHEEVFGEPPVVLAFPDVFAPIPMSLESGLDEAIRRNPDLQSAKAQVEAASSEYKAARGAQFPRLELEANLNSYDLTRNGTDYYDSFIGLKLSHSLLDGGLKRSSREKSQSQLQRARAEYDNTVRAVELALKRAYANRESLIPQYKALQAQLDHKRETRRAYEEQFLAGRRPLNDLVAAQQQVLDTALRMVEFKSELHRQHFSILSLVGELFVKEGEGRGYSTLNGAMNP